jgi:hypothetical protein
MNRILLPIVLAGTVRACVGAVVERFVASSADIEHDSNVRATGLFGAHLTTAAGKQQRYMHKQKSRGDDEEFAHSRGKNRTQRPVRQGRAAPFYSCAMPIDFTSMSERVRTRFLVVGSGVAGLHTALRASSEGDVMVLTKRSLFRQRYGVCPGRDCGAPRCGRFTGAPPPRYPAAGAALCDARAGRGSRRGSPARVRELQTAGAHFDLEPGGDFKLGREAAHSRRRIVHARGDQTGAEVARALIDRVSDSERIEVLEKTRVLDLIVSEGKCYGVRATVAGVPTEILADATVLATGGCGQVYKYTTNPQVATGDGYAIAHRAGVKLADMEFVQFHPTALETPENPLALISEAVRGEGAILVNDAGARFMVKRHRLAELAPRGRRSSRDFSRESARERRLPGCAEARSIVQEAIPGNLCALPGAWNQSDEGPDPGNSCSALHDGRHRY